MPAKQNNETEIKPQTERAHRHLLEIRASTCQTHAGKSGEVKEETKQ